MRTLKRLVLIGLLLLGTNLLAQVPTPVKTVSVLPTTCNGGNAQIFTDTVMLAVNGLSVPYYCKGNNTWSPYSTSALSWVDNGQVISTSEIVSAPLFKTTLPNSGISLTEGDGSGLGAILSGTSYLYADSTRHCVHLINNGNDYGLCTSGTLASGATAMGTSAISSGTCATVITVFSQNVDPSQDLVLIGFSGDPTATTGYIPSTSGMLTIIAYPTTNNVNFKVCNNTSASITPGALTVNWRVVR